MPTHTLTLNPAKVVAGDLICEAIGEKYLTFVVSSVGRCCDGSKVHVELETGGALCFGMLDEVSVYVRGLT